DAGGQRRGDREGGGRGPDTTGARGGSEQSPDPPLRRVGRRAAFSQGRGAILGREAAARRSGPARLTTPECYVVVRRVSETPLARRCFWLPPRIVHRRGTLPDYDTHDHSAAAPQRAEWG